MSVKTKKQRVGTVVGYMESRSLLTCILVKLSFRLRGHRYNFMTDKRTWLASDHVIIMSKREDPEYYSVYLADSEGKRLDFGPIFSAEGSFDGFFKAKRIKLRYAFKKIKRYRLS